MGYLVKQGRVGTLSPLAMEKEHCHCIFLRGYISLRGVDVYLAKLDGVVLERRTATVSLSGQSYFLYSFSL